MIFNVITKELSYFAFLTQFEHDCRTENHLKTNHPPDLSQNDKTEEMMNLRRATRDVIEISSLPSVWVHYNTEQIAESVVETLSKGLHLDFVFVRITNNETQVQSGYAQGFALQQSELENLAEKLTPWLRPEILSAPLDMVSPFSEEKLQVVFSPIGHAFSHGVIVTGSSRKSFPLDTERLVLNIAANQTSVTIQHKWLQEKTKSLLELAEHKEIQLRDAQANLNRALIVAEAAKAEAIKTSELKSSFLANMSHEIRTPLGAILGFTEVLKTSNLSSVERKEYLEIITRSGQNLTKIIDDILDLSKIEADKLEIENAPLFLADLCKEVIFMFSDKAYGKGILLNLDDSKFPKFKVNSDQVRIRQILVNLIGNAVKFTSQGSINVSGEYTEIADNTLFISIYVADTGVGMPKGMSEGLFKPFTQGDNTSTRKFGGTGLGLTLSKKLGNALGGDVTLDKCEENKGCTFKFEFVAFKSLNSEAGAKEKIKNENLNNLLLKGYNILVADDSPDNRLLIDIILTRQGALVELACDGEEAVNKALAGNFDAVLMDIQMPVLDGYAALARLRRENFRKPIFALTADAMKEERNRALASGFVDHIAKPVNTRALIDSILTHASCTQPGG